MTEKKRKSGKKAPANSCNVRDLKSSSRYPGMQGGMAGYQIWFEFYEELLENPPPNPDPTTYRRGLISS
ncbi:hypothetical protein M2324_003673 [Rhodovulum sulfidophilum]|uniref:hypothetical protein n=1 Tax=Rhodovulum sulfidophilum TaxID=35806 RepID=UPI000A6343FD|nr:hypothetical protein [Rhodovulum sulfidophilum]MCW2305252.1 hypothetical protein [Rhodovulum sulfidophilum]